MTYLLYIVIFLFGLIVGSFLNAVIYRLHSGDSITKDRSKCIKCKKVLSWQELIPVVSFIIQKGKCRGCGEFISLQYPIVEVTTGFIFLLIFNYQFSIINEVSISQLSNADYQLILQFVFLLITVSSLVIIFVYDLKHYLIPDKILFPLIGITALARFFNFWTLGHWKIIESWSFNIINLNSLVSGIIVGLIAALFFFSLFYFSKGRAMGFGDVKLAFFMGLLLGFPGILTALFIAFTTGAIIGIVLILIKKKNLQSKVPFAPFLIFGTFIALFWSKDIIDWYLGLFV
ncbi:MAG: prepilin peptidase [Candidatus Spechtbacterales bacterium]|nr:prepilin peptidase [Candidatus Spechtbacterales bacterium]